jgi:2-amino-4-hydroxy-6-hydroxymethyldihydropteridine diphosphokinase
MQTTAYIALGSNLGDRRGYLERAIHSLREHPAIEVCRVSRFYETAPVGGPAAQPNFLNGAAELLTTLSAEELLHTLLNIESSLGRVRRERDGPRTIDLDLIFYADLVRSSPDPILPHPRLHERPFVLRPLAEIAPDVKHPSTGLTVCDLLQRLPRETYAPRGELTGLRAVVTGSTRGIGLAIAREFAVAGAQVILHGRDVQAGTAAMRDLSALADGLQFIPADVSLPAECTRLVEAAWGQTSGIDVWVNNAGADTLTGDARHWSFTEKLDRLLEVDVKATVELSRQVGKRMKDRGTGTIINIGWDQAETGMEGDSGQLFGIAKSAIMAFTKSLALSLAPKVRVNCIAPGWIRTAWGESASKVWQERVLRETPMARWGAPEDVAAAARWLASPAASFVTGQIIRVNGGAVR